MALSVSEQLDVLSGNNFTFPSASGYTLQQMVSQAALAWSTDFLQTYTDGAESLGYYQKVSSLAASFQRADRRAGARLTEVMVGQIARTSFTFAQVAAADEAQWSSFIQDNIDEVILVLAGVTKAEVAEYAAL